LGRALQLCKLVEDAALEDGHGLALRFRMRAFVPPDGTTLRNYLSEQVATMSADVRKTDLLIDLEYIDPDAELGPGDLAAPLKEMLAVRVGSPGTPRRYLTAAVESAFRI
jgi:hypothetical protein